MAGMTFEKTMGEAVIVNYCDCHCALGVIGKMWVHKVLLGI